MSMFMCPAVHTMTHSLLRSSSTHEPSDPPLRVKIFVFKNLVINIFIERNQKYTKIKLAYINSFNNLFYTYKVCCECLSSKSFQIRKEKEQINLHKKRFI